MKQKTLIAVVGCLALSSCVASVSTNPLEDGSESRQLTAGFDAAAEAAKLVPEASLYTSQAFDWRDNARTRNVPVRLYLPTSSAAGVAGSVPLVVFSHGLGGSRDGYKYLGRFFAAMAMRACICNTSAVIGNCGLVILSVCSGE